MVKITRAQLIWIAFSFIVAWGFNNITRQLENIDSGLMALLTVSSLSFVLGTLLYTRAKDDVIKKELVFRFILTGMAIIFALSLTGFAGDARADQRIVAFHSCDVDSVCSAILFSLASFLNFSALFIFFYSSIELIYYFKDRNSKSLSDRMFTKTLIFISIVLYIFLSGILSLFIPSPALETFATNVTDETFLHIEDKDWLISLNLTGFEDLDTEKSPTKFFTKNNGPMTISVYAEKVPKVFNEEKCLAYLSPAAREKAISLGVYSLEPYNRKGHQLILEYNYTFGGIEMNDLNYYDYYDGYCFDFYMTTVFINNRTMEETYELLDSIKLVILHY